MLCLKPKYESLCIYNLKITITKQNIMVMVNAACFIVVCTLNIEENMACAVP